MIKKHIKSLVWASGGLIISTFIVIQIKSFENVTPLLRDDDTNIFQEIKVLKEENDDLNKEVERLEEVLVQLSDKNSALSVIDEEIKKYKKLTGNYKIFGPGVSVVIEGKITTPWMVDLVNEFFNAGAQAVAVNGIRLTNETVGFDTLPQGQILINGSILSEPYTFDVIGEPKVLINVFELPAGIFERIRTNLPNIKITAIQKEIIQMN